MRPAARPGGRHYGTAYRQMTVLGFPSQPAAGRVGGGSVAAGSSGPVGRVVLRVQRSYCRIVEHAYKKKDNERIDF